MGMTVQFILDRNMMQCESWGLQKICDDLNAEIERLTDLRWEFYQKRRESEEEMEDPKDGDGLDGSLLVKFHPTPLGIIMGKMSKTEIPETVRFLKKKFDTVLWKCHDFYDDTWFDGDKALCRDEKKYGPIIVRHWYELEEEDNHDA
jgi:hypothetical protein